MNAAANVLSPAPLPVERSVETLRSELMTIARKWQLEFPIAAKQDFIDQVVGRGDTVRFESREFPAGFAAGLIPSFFFPIGSEEELISKVLELLRSRGWHGHAAG